VWRPADVFTNGVEKIKTRGKEDSPVVGSVRPPPVAQRSLSQAFSWEVPGGMQKLQRTTRAMQQFLTGAVLSLEADRPADPPKVHNKHHGTAPEDAVYIGRPSPWGNPFEIGKDGDRAEVIRKFELRLEKSEELKARVRKELKGRHLVCFCKPAACHGDVLLRFANSED